MLLMAKQKGKNRICIYNQDSTLSGFDLPG
jgi:hypothetical protein